MAKYKDCFDSSSIYSEEYLVEGELSDEDIEWINSIDRKTKLRFKNTKYLNSLDISRIDNNNVIFSIDGGETRVNKENRKEITPLALATVLYYFETIESEIDSNWTQLQKAMYVYNVLCTDFEYVKKIVDETSLDLCRSLTGILYGKLTCAGFAIVYKEFMDRLGITCFYEGVENVHRYNVLEIDNKFIGIDVTRDNGRINENKVSDFKNFGRDERFYYRYGHSSGKLLVDNKISLEEREFLKKKFNLDVSEDAYSLLFLDIISYYNNMKDFYDHNDEEILESIKESIITDVSKYDKKGDCYFIPDKDEKRYDLTILSQEQIDSNLSVIRDKLNKRSKKTFDLFMSDPETRKKYLVQYFDGDVIIKKNNPDYDYVKEIPKLFAMIDMLNSYGINEEKYSTFKNFFRGMYSSALDLRYKKPIYLDINGLKFEYKCENKEGRIPNFSWFYQGMEDTSSSMEMVLKAKDDIDKKLDDYTKRIIDDVILNYDKYIMDYYKYKDSYDERIDFQFIPILICSKFSMFIYHEDELLKMNYRVDEVKKITSKLQNEFAPKRQTIDNIIEMDKDFLYAVFEDLNDVKNEFELFEKRIISDEEFMEKLYNIDYLRKVFDLSEYHLSDEDYKELFDSIIKEKRVL